MGLKIKNEYESVVSAFIFYFHVDVVNNLEHTLLVTDHPKVLELIVLQCTLYLVFISLSCNKYIKPVVGGLFIALSLQIKVSMFFN